MSACTCTACGREFSGLAAFDRHQSVDYSRRPAVECLDPAALGLIRDPVSGRWGTTDGSAKREQGARLAASRVSHHAQTGEQPPARVSGCSPPHDSDSRCFDCATDDELAAAIPPWPEGA